MGASVAGMAEAGAGLRRQQRLVPVLVVRRAGSREQPLLIVTYRYKPFRRAGAREQPLASVCWGICGRL